MSCDSVIGILDDGAVTHVTCHNGGGQRLAMLLNENYSGPDVEALVDLGDLSSVGPTLKDCSAYKRDWGRPFRQRRTRIQEFLDSDVVRNVYWVYVWDCEEDRWYYCRSGDFRLHSFECPSYLQRG